MKSLYQPRAPLGSDSLVAHLRRTVARHDLVLPRARGAHVDLAQLCREFGALDRAEVVVELRS